MCFKHISHVSQSQAKNANETVGKHKEKAKIKKK